MSFELRDHTADIGVAATGDSLESAFAAVADGLAAASCDEVPAAPSSSETDASAEPFELSVAAESREALLFDYLDELIYLRDVRLELPADNAVTIRTEGDEWCLEGRARGVPLEEITAREIKAVTYSEMRLEDRDGEWEAYVVFDV
ncbi:archease [Natrononativus amylolyticus]|uniref:archease n=1 Tax=Natrononativus amylolyticus TaxID=2963434 RepID=UPI0020CFC050|nr:archease [Natrononativus amylolyticus]